MCRAASGRAPTRLWCGWTARAKNCRPQPIRRPHEFIAARVCRLTASWWPEGTILTFYYSGAPDIWLLPLGPAFRGRSGGAAPVKYQDTPFEKFAAQFSPDGRWLAYGASAERQSRVSTFSSQVYVQPAPT